MNQLQPTLELDHLKILPPTLPIPYSRLRISHRLTICSIFYPTNGSEFFLSSFAAPLSPLLPFSCLSMTFWAFIPYSFDIRPILLQSLIVSVHVSHKYQTMGRIILYYLGHHARSERIQSWYPLNSCFLSPRRHNFCLPCYSAKWYLGNLNVVLSNTPNLT